MARLITSVHVADESGVGHVFGPSDAVPSWAAARITNPAAWDGPPPEPEVTEPVVVETETTTESETVTEEVAPETVSAAATEEELTPDLAAESVSEPETVEPEPETVKPEPEPVTAAPKRRGRPAKATTNN